MDMRCTGRIGSLIDLKENASVIITLVLLLYLLSLLYGQGDLDSDLATACTMKYLVEAKWKLPIIIQYHYGKTFHFFLDMCECTSMLP